MTIPLYTQKDLQVISESFTKELDDARDGQSNSLAYLQNPLASSSFLSNSDVVQVMSIGGTLCKTAYIHNHEGVLEFTDYDITSIPLFDTKEHFLSYVTKHIKKDATILALNFAYPMAPILRNEHTDGILLRTTKEHTFKGLIGEIVGEQIENAVMQEYGRQLQVITANDTVCLALSGLEVSSWDKVVGGIVGTGTNMGFFADEHTIINLESGNFDKLKQTESGRYVDSISTNPGKHLFEKEISGAYLYQHYNYYLKLLDPTLPKLQSTLEMSAITDKQIDQYSLVTQLINRSASLFTTQIAGMINHLKKDHVSFIMEGSVFWDIPLYTQYLHTHIHGLGIQPSAFSFHHIVNSNLKGTAHLTRC